MDPLLPLESVLPPPDRPAQPQPQSQEESPSSPPSVNPAKPSSSVAPSVVTPPAGSVKAITPVSNGSAKAGIAAAIAAFEKGSGEMNGPPLKSSFQSPKKPLATRLAENKADNKAENKAGAKPAVAPRGGSVQCAVEGPKLSGQAKSSSALDAPSSDLLTGAESQSLVELRNPESTGSKPELKTPLPLKSTSAAKASTAGVPSKPSPAAARIANPGPNKAASTRSPFTPIGTNPTKPAPRASTAARQSAAAAPARPPNRDSAPGPSTQFKSPPAVKAQTAARRSSLAAGTTKAPSKAPVPLAAARKLLANAVAADGTRSATTASTVSTKRLSAGPPAVGKAAGTPRVATGELESKLSKIQSELSEKCARVEELERSLEGCAQEASVREQSLRSQLEVLNAKLDEATKNSQSEAPESIDQLGTARTNLTEAQNRVTELTEMLRLQQVDQSQLAAQQVESLTQVSKLEEVIKDLKKQVEEVQCAKVEEIEKLNQQHLAQLEERLNQERLEFDNVKNTLLSQVQVANDSVKNMEVECAKKLDHNISTQVAEREEEMTEKHANELAELAKSHAAKVETLTSHHESALQRLQETLHSERALVKETLANREHDLASLTAELCAKHVEEFQNAVTTVRAEAVANHEAELSKSKEDAAIEIGKLKAELIEMGRVKEELEAERTELKAQVDRLAKEKFESEESLSTQLEALKSQNAIEVEREFQRAKDELNVTHTEELQSLRQKLEKTVTVLGESHEAQLEAARVCLLSDFASEKTLLQSELAQAKLELEALHSDLSRARTSNQERTDQVTHLQDEVNRLTQSLKEAETHVADASSAEKDAELTKLQAELNDLQDELQIARDSLVETEKQMRMEFEHARERHEEEIKEQVKDKAMLKAQVEDLRESLAVNHHLLTELTRGAPEEPMSAQLHEASSEKVKQLEGKILELTELLRKTQESKDDLDVELTLLGKSFEEKEHGNNGGARTGLAGGP